MLTFNQWLNQNRKHSNPYATRFVEICIDDSDKPKGTASLDEWKCYLKEIDADNWEFDALEFLWKKFNNQKKRAA